MHPNVKLALLWTTLSDIKSALDEKAVPLAYHLDTDDAALVEAMEALSEKIGAHFERFELKAQPVKKTMPAGGVYSRFFKKSEDPPFKPTGKRPQAGGGGGIPSGNGSALSGIGRTFR